MAVRYTAERALALRRAHFQFQQEKAFLNRGLICGNIAQLCRCAKKQSIKARLQ